VVGLRYNPLERLLADITGATSPAAVTIARSVGYLAPGNSIPALHFLRGDTSETRSSLAQGFAHYGQNMSMPVVAEYHRCANALTARLPAQTSGCTASLPAATSPSPWPTRRARSSGTARGLAAVRVPAVATRYDRLAVRYEATVLIAALNEWL
jgi:hypothetical protein